MITHKLILYVGGRERPLTIHADHRTLNSRNEIEFYDAQDHLFATVPADIIIKHTEA